MSGINILYTPGPEQCKQTNVDKWQDKNLMVNRRENSSLVLRSTTRTPWYAGMCLIWKM